MYGYGWFIKDIDSVKTVEHSGSTDGYQTDEIYLPHQDVFVVCLFNGFEADMDWQVISNDVARFALGHPLRKQLKFDDDSLKALTGTYTFTAQHKLVITFKDHGLFVEATNPKDRLPRVHLYAESKTQFYIKEAPLRFEFVWDTTAENYKLVTYNSFAKDAEWKKEK